MATVNYTSLLGLALPTTGDLSGTWGNEVNEYLSKYVDSAVEGTQTISGSQTAVTLSVANGTSLSQAGSGATGSAQFAIINCTGNPAGLLTITAPASSRQYIVLNSTSTSQSVKIVGAGPTTGVTLVSGEKAVVAWNGSDFTKVTSSVSEVTLAGNNAFTGANTFYNATGQTFGTATAAQDGIILAGRAGGTSTYRVTITPTTLAGNRTVTLPDANTTIPVATQVLTFTGPSAARTYTLPDAASTLAALGTAQTFTATQTFSGSSSVLSMVLNDAAEVITVSATAATGTINYDITTQSVLYYTTNASANWTVNFRASSGTSLDTALSTGQCITVAFLVTQGSTAYYNSAVQVDGNAITPKWQGGTAPTAGNASSIDAYVYTIVKTGSAAFTVFASQTKFA